MEIVQVPEDSRVWLRLRIDTAALEAAANARMLLIKRIDSLRSIHDGRRLLVSELEIILPDGIAEVTGRTWGHSSKGRVRLTFDYRDSQGTAGTLDAWLGMEAIDRVFVFQESTPTHEPPNRRNGAPVARSKPGSSVVFILVGPIVGGLAGLLYGKLKGDGGNSQPGMTAFVYSMGGMAMGLWMGVEIALYD